MPELNDWALVASNLVIVLLIGGATLRHARKDKAVSARPDAGITFIFDGSTLVEQSEAARALLPQLSSGEADWQRFLGVFSKNFPHLEERLGRVGGKGYLAIESSDGSGDRIEAHYWSGLVRIEIQKAAQPPRQEGTTLNTATSTAADLSTDPMWAEDDDRQITWANRAYLALADRHSPPQRIAPWPPARIFDCEEGEVSIAAGRGENGARYRISVAAITGGAVCVAHDITEITSADRSKTAMVNAFGSAFSTLSTGLALFGPDKTLCSFNPALTEVLGLKPELLTHSPTIEGFLGLLRDEAILPEPANYSAWRQTVVAVEAGAEEGSYNEDWTLPDGRTVRVSGRPQASGSCALLFEDISPQLAAARTTRRFNLIWKDALEQSETPLLVLAESGKVLGANAAYCALWGVTPSECESYDGQRLIWGQKTLSRKAIDAFPSRLPTAPQNLALTTPDGAATLLTIRKISGGATVISFTAAENSTTTQDAEKTHKVSA